MFFHGFHCCLFPVTNVGIGLSLFSIEFSRFCDLTLLWVFVACNLLLHFVTFGMCMLRSKRSVETNGSAKKEVKTDALQMKDKKGQQEKKKERKPPSPDAPLRWIGLVAFLTVTSLTLLTLLALIALPMK